MNILLVEKNKMTRPLYLFFDGISEGLCIKIFNKFQSYVQHGDIYHGNESAGVLFSKSKDGNLKIIHAFLKSTRKTPAKEAQQAIKIYQMLIPLETVIRDKQSIHC